MSETTNQPKAQPGEVGIRLVSEEEVRAAVLKREQLQTRLLEAQLAELDLKNEQKASVRRQRQHDLDVAVREFEASVRACSHRKGGTGMKGVTGGGTDSNFATIHHMMPSGEIFVLCTKCSGMWRPSADPAEQAEYEKMLNAPTDNQPSGSSLFSLRRNNPDDRRPIRWGQETTDNPDAQKDDQKKN